MWSALWKWASGSKLLAIAIVVLGVTALGSAADGWSARRAAQFAINRAKEWAAAYSRDTAASKKEYEGKIKVLTADRDAYRKKYDAAKGKMGAPWKAPGGPTELEQRYRALGYSGRVK